MEVVCVRIGNVNPGPWTSGAFRSGSRRAISRSSFRLRSTGGIRFEIVYGVSGNRRSWYDNANAERLGYSPLDDSEGWAEEILNNTVPGADPRTEKYQGGLSVSQRTAETHARQGCAQGRGRKGREESK